MNDLFAIAKRLQILIGSGACVLRPRRPAAGGKRTTRIPRTGNALSVDDSEPVGRLRMITDWRA